MKLHLRPVSVLWFTLALIAALLLINLGSYFLRYVMDHDYALGLIPLFDIRNENTVPTLFSVLLIFSLVPALYVAGATADTGRYYWFGLALLFAFLSADEFLGFHERLSHIIVDGTDIDRRQWAWPIPYLAALAIAGVILLPFLKSLPRRTMRLFVVSGIIYVTGAAGIEIFGGWYKYEVGQFTLGYDLVQLVEEGLEMLGMALFLYSVLDHLARVSPGTAVVVHNEPPQ